MHLSPSNTLFTFGKKHLKFLYKPLEQLPFVASISLKVTSFSKSDKDYERRGFWKLNSVFHVFLVSTTTFTFYPDFLPDLLPVGFGNHLFTLIVLMLLEELTIFDLLIIFFLVIVFGLPSLF
jgi:hypothetical protein